MNVSRFRRFLALSAIAMLCFAASPARANISPSGWVWISPTDPYGYAVNEAGWLYFSQGVDMWFYNYGSDQWSNQGPDGWMWFAWPFAYSSDDAAWIYVQAPASGLWVYHYASSQWIPLY